MMIMNIEALKNRAFTLLWIGQSTSEIGSNVSTIALMWLIASQTSDPSAVSLLFIVLTIPSIVIGPWAGVLIDRWNKKTVMLVTDIARGMIAVLLAYSNSIDIMYVLAFAQQILNSFFSPTLKSVIPCLVKKNDLTSANALSTGMSAIAKLIGPVIGGCLIGFFGAKSAFILDGISFFISAFFVTLISMPAVNNIAAQNIQPDLLEEFKKGISYIWSRKIVLFVIVFFAMDMLFAGGLPILHVLLINKVLGFSAEEFGLLMTINGFGILLGTLVISKLEPKFAAISIMVFGEILFGLCYIGLTFSNVLYGVALCFLLLGIIASNINIAYSAYLQNEVDLDKQGRVFSIDIAIGNCVGIFSMGFVGFLANAFDVRCVILFDGFFFLLLGIAALHFPVYKRYVNKLNT